MMKRNILIAGVAGMVILGGAFGANALANTNQADIITKEEAKRIALKESNGTVKSIELERENGQLEYEVEIAQAGKADDVEVDINAMTGTPVKVKKLENTHASTKKDQISMEEAIAIAKKHTSGKVIETDFDYDDNEYEIEIRTEKAEVEITIDSRSGKVIKVETDDHDDDKGFNKRLNSNVKGKISLEEAISIATKDSPGKVTETDFDSDDREYEIEIKTNDAEIEITIDAYSGKITDKEMDRYDD